MGTTDLSVWHEYHTFIALGATDVGEANTSVASRSFDDCAPWFKPANADETITFEAVASILTCHFLQHPGLGPAQLCL